MQPPRWGLKVWRQQDAFSLLPRTTPPLTLQSLFCRPRPMLSQPSTLLCQMSPTYNPPEGVLPPPAESSPLPSHRPREGGHKLLMRGP